jgi:hypothetical protein
LNFGGPSNNHPQIILYNQFSRHFIKQWLTHQRKRTHTARNAANTLNTKLRSTNLAKLPILLKVNEDMTESKKVSVDKPNQFFTRKQRQLKKLPCDWSAKSAKLSLTNALNVVNLSNLVPKKQPVVTNIKQYL